MTHSNDSKQIIRADLDPWSRAIALRLGWKRSDGSLDVVTDLMVKHYESTDGCLAVDPFVTLCPTEAQQLMDELWRCGIRPVEGHGSVGQLAATENHLHDMQALVFRWMDRALPDRAVVATAPLGNSLPSEGALLDLKSKLDKLEKAMKAPQ